MLRHVRHYRMLFLILWLAACIREPMPTAVPTQSDQGATKPSVVRIGRKGSPDSLNPGVAQLYTAYTIFNLVYDAMFLLDLDGAFKPVLAESYQASADGKQWTFQIRKGFKFHDGQPLTARDIAFSYNFYKTNNDGFPLIKAQLFDTVTAPDDHTVVIQLAQVTPSIESYLAALAVLPEHIWSAHTTGQEPVEFQNTELIGSGPFKLAAYQQNEFVHLVANREYPLTPPSVDKVIFQTFTNEDALVKALRIGQVDMITELPNLAAPTLRNAEAIKLAVGASFLPEAADIAINQLQAAHCPTNLGAKCTGHPALRDRNVRLALAHATDKQNLIDVLLLGMGKPGLTLTPDGLGTWYNATLQDYPFDVAQANQILDQAGYKDTDGDGVRELPDGSRPLLFRLQWPSDLISGPRLAELLGQSWGQIGIQVEPQAVDPDALIALCCPGFDYDLMLWSWFTDPDPGTLLNLMTTEAIGGGSNESGYANPVYDELYNRQAAELDPEKRKALIWQLQEIAHNDVVYIIPYYPQRVQAYRTDRFTGWGDDQPLLALEHPSSLVRITPVQ